MNFLQKNARWIAAVAGCAGGALRMWTLSVGEDDKALFPAHHPGWIGYLVLSAAMILLCLVIFRKDSPTVPQKQSLSLAVHGLAAAGFQLYSIGAVSGTGFVSLLVAFLSFACTAGLIVALWQQAHGTAPTRFAYLFSCLFFVLLMFQTNYTYAGEPELSRFVPQFLAAFSAALACYQFWGRAVDLPNGKKQLFWQCVAGYLCLAAAPGAHILYGCVGIFLLVGPYFPPVCSDEPIIEEPDQSMIEESSE